MLDSTIRLCDSTISIFYRVKLVLSIVGYRHRNLFNLNVSHCLCLFIDVVWLSKFGSDTKISIVYVFQLFESLLIFFLSEAGWFGQFCSDIYISKVQFICLNDLTLGWIRIMLGQVTLSYSVVLQRSSAAVTVIESHSASTYGTD